MHVLCLSRNQPWYVRPTLVSKSFCFALIFSVNHLLRRRSNPFSRTICPFLLTRQNTLRYDCQYGIGCMGMEKKAETWYVPPCITAFLNHFLQFSEEPARSRMHPFWWQKHQKGRKKGHACRVRLVKTVGPFFFGLIFSGPFVTWSVKDLVSHQFGTINSCMIKWCAQKSFKLITQIRATRWLTKDPSTIWICP